MTDAVIRLDKTKPYSECRGERLPDDPHYRVAFMQGQAVGKEMVLLPFDAHGNLVPDDGKTAPWTVLDPNDPDGKRHVTHHPLYTKAMRDLVEKKKKRQAIIAAKPENEDEFDPTDTAAAAEEVNVEAFLRGEARYEWHILQAACKKRFARVFKDKKELVTELVLDEKIVSEAELAPGLAKLLPEREAAA